MVKTMSNTNPKTPRPERPEPRPGLRIEHLDLRGVTRDSDRFVCDIRLDTGDYSNGGSMKTWITCGRIDVHFPDSHGSAKPGTLSARATEGVTDFEHDSAYIFQIQVSGWVVAMVANGFVYAECVIVGDAEDLRVPRTSDYDPTKLPGAAVCKEPSCATKHPIVPEGYWAGPPASDAMWRNLVGRRLEIVFGPTMKTIPTDEHDGTFRKATR